MNVASVSPLLRGDSATPLNLVLRNFGRREGTVSFRGFNLCVLLQLTPSWRCHFTSEGMEAHGVRLLCLRSQWTVDLWFHSWSFWCQSPCILLLLHHGISWGKTSSGDSERMSVSGGSSLNIVRPLSSWHKHITCRPCNMYEGSPCRKQAGRPWRPVPGVRRQLSNPFTNLGLRSYCIGWI